MKFKTKQWLAVLVQPCILPLAGCSYFNAKAEKVQPTTREQQCADLKTTLTIINLMRLDKQNPTQQADAMNYTTSMIAQNLRKPALVNGQKPQLFKLVTKMIKLPGW